MSLNLIYWAGFGFSTSNENTAICSITCSAMEIYFAQFLPFLNTLLWKSKTQNQNVSDSTANYLLAPINKHKPTELEMLWLSSSFSLYDTMNLIKLNLRKKLDVLCFETFTVEGGWNRHPPLKSLPQVQTLCRMIYAVIVEIVSFPLWSEKIPIWRSGSILGFVKWKMIWGPRAAYFSAYKSL